MSNTMNLKEMEMSIRGLDIKGNKLYAAGLEGHSIDMEKIEKAKKLWERARTKESSVRCFKTANNIDIR